MKKLAYSPLVATLRRESRKSCGQSSALCTIPFSFPKRQCTVTGILYSVNSLQAIAHSNLTSVFPYFLQWSTHNCLFHFPGSVLPLQKDAGFARKHRLNSTDFKYKLIQVFDNEGKTLPIYIYIYILSSVQDVLWDLKYPSGQDMERPDGTFSLAFILGSIQ